MTKAAKARKAPSAQSTEVPVVTPSIVALDHRPLRYAVAGGVLAMFGLFYWFIELFQVNNLNDFSEYYVRALDWTRGGFAPSDADILLSVVEYFGILIHPQDFLGSYYAASRILIVLLFLGSFLFVVRRNNVLPDFWTKLCLVAIALSIPHFLMATVTIDQTLLFGACLLLFLSTYNIPWAGFVGLMVFFSRKEGVIVVPLYIILFLIDREHRKMIAINAATFVVLLVGMKYWVVASQNAPAPSAVSAAFKGQEYQFLDGLGWQWFKGFFSHVSNIPVIIFAYAYEALQNVLLFVLFSVGFVFSIRQKTAWAFYGIVTAYLIAFSVNVAGEGIAGPYSGYTSLIGKMSREHDYFIVNAFNKYDSAIGGHGRYRLFLYPAYAFFVVQGIALILGLLSRMGLAKTMSRYGNYLLAGIAGIICLYYVGYRLTPIKQEYATSKRLEQLHPVYKLGLNLYSRDNVGTLFIDNFCDASQGSFLVELGTFSGVKDILTRFCDNSRIWVSDSSKGSVVLDAPAYKQQMPSNPTMLAMFRNANASSSELYDSAVVTQWEKIAFTLNDTLMRTHNITHIIAARRINHPRLRVVDSIDKAFLHAYMF